MTTREYLAMKLREYRNAKDLNVDKVGAAIGKSGKTISAWEVGRGQPDADMLVELCKLYGVRISDFFNPEVSDDSVLTTDECELLADYRAMNDQGKIMARGMVAALAKSGDYAI